MAGGGRHPGRRPHHQCGGAQRDPERPAPEEDRPQVQAVPASNDPVPRRGEDLPGRRRRRGHRPWIQLSRGPLRRDG